MQRMAGAVISVSVNVATAKTDCFAYNTPRKSGQKMTLDQMIKNAQQVQDKLLAKVAALPDDEQAKLLRELEAK